MIEFQAAFVAVACLHHRHVYLLLMGKVLALQSVGVENGNFHRFTKGANAIKRTFLYVTVHSRMEWNFS